MKTVGDCKFIHGYEVPKKTSKKTLKILKQLRKRGFVLLLLDDSTNPVSTELKEICDSIGLEYQERGSDQIWVMDENNLSFRSIVDLTN